MNFKRLVWLFACVIATAATSSVEAQDNWYPYVIARPSDRATIQSTPIHQRPYRPLHFYGNTVRRNFERTNSTTLFEWPSRPTAFNNRDLRFSFGRLRR